MDNEEEIKEQIEAMRVVAALMLSLTPFAREQLSLYIKNLTDWMNEKPEVKKQRIETEIERLQQRLVVLESQKE